MAKSAAFGLVDWPLTNSDNHSFQDAHPPRSKSTRRVQLLSQTSLPQSPSKFVKLVRPDASTDGNLICQDHSRLLAFRHPLC